jgi:type IV pilus assembly protein PilV
MLMKISAPGRSAGFSMIEVLVSLIIIVIGVLGMVALQSKAIPYTQDSTQRNTAIMLVDDLVEIIRSGKTEEDCITQSTCTKALGTPFPSPPNSCIPTPQALADQISCWAARAGKMLPGGTSLLSNSFYICHSITPNDVVSGSCPTESAIDTELEIQVAWTVKSASDCMDGSTGTTAGICSYKLRTRIK